MSIIRKKVVLLHPQNDASVAQLVEHLTLNQGVQGSTPCGSTKKPLKISGFRCFYPHAGSTNCWYNTRYSTTSFANPSDAKVSNAFCSLTQM